MGDDQAPEMEITRGYVELSLAEAERAGNGQQVRLLRSWLDQHEGAVAFIAGAKLRDAELAAVEVERDALWDQAQVAHLAIEKLREERTRLRAFAGSILEGGWDVPDYEDVWTLGQKHGLFVRIPGGFDPERHHDATGCLDRGDDFFRLAWEPEGSGGC